MVKDSLTGRNVLVTGGTGSIGSQLVREVLRHKPARVQVFSRDDSKHFYFQQELRKHDNVRFMIGDIRDTQSLSRAFEGGIDVVLHAAALKHVAICEQNPTEAVKTNILGTQNLVDLAHRSHVQTMITVSTDKAVNPTCTMGATKYIAEKLTLSANPEPGHDGPAFACVRFGNVLGSRGSVIPAFQKALSDHGQLFVSDPEVTRFAITIQEAANLVVRAADQAKGGEIFVLKMQAFRLGDLVDVFRTQAGRPEPKVRVLGLSPGEKLHEELVTSDEIHRLHESKEFYVILPSRTNGNGRLKGLRRATLTSYSSASAPRMDRQTLARHVRDALAPADD